MTDTPIRIFVGYSGNDEDLEFASVLHYSLETQASRPLDITWMRLSRDPKSFWYADPQTKRGWRTDRWATPFSALRWGIPAFCNFQGKAIYMDIDMIAMADIAELWDQDVPQGFGMLAKPEAPCVTLYDNAKMKQILPPIDTIKFTPGLYRDIRNHIKPVAKRYVGNWNCLDMRKDGPAGGQYKSVFDPDIKVLHFTEIPTQPHLRYAIPRLKEEGRSHWYNKMPLRPHPRKDAVELFDNLLTKAQHAGYELDRYRNPTPFGDYGR
jgi:hypothetical protein